MVVAMVMAAMVVKMISITNMMTSTMTVVITTTTVVKFKLSYMLGSWQLGGPGGGSWGWGAVSITWL